MRSRSRSCDSATSHFALRTGNVLLSLLFVAASTTVPAAQRPGTLTAAPQISRAYDAVFDARFDQVPAILAQTCPPAPAEVCALLDVVNRWWQIQLDPENRSRDSQFLERADAAIAAVDAWTKREPGRAEAWFYLGGAYGARAQLRVLRGETLAAARDGKRIKEALERSLALDPMLQDAYFGLGLYHYYAGVAPTAAKILRFLLALPGGDRTAGLEEMLRARNSGQILRDEADYQLHLIDLWYEKQPQHALVLLRGLRDRHPRNPHFWELIARVEDAYLHDSLASERSWNLLLEAAENGRVELRRMADASARLALAPRLDAKFETDVALDYVRRVLVANPAAPYGAVERAHQLQRRYQERLEAPTDAARAYRLSLEGWRAYQRGALPEASRLLQQSIALRPKEMVARYRLARVLDAQHNDDAAVEMFESVLLSFETTPPAFYAYACVDAARLYERRGETARAVELYRRALPIYGADPQTKETAQAALTRLSAER